jgi:hypothetical protein
MPDPLPTQPSRTVLLPEPGPRVGTPLGDTPWSCVMCFRSAPQPAGCCSMVCADDANAEFAYNARVLCDLPAGARPATAHRLAERNGRLSSALLRWHAAGGRAGPSPLAWPATARPVPRPASRELLPA